MPASREYVVRTLLAGLAVAALVPRPLPGQEITIVAVGDIEWSRATKPPAMYYDAVSFHWGIENSQEVHPGMRDFAHDVLDAGADAILGHHPHVPRGIEVRDGKPIVYSMGNFIFGHGHDYWMDNIAVRLHLDAEGVTRLDVLPIAGRGDDLSQPYLLEGEAARTLLEDIRARSAGLGTTLRIEGDAGVIDVSR